LGKVSVRIPVKSWNIRLNIVSMCPDPYDVP